MRVLRWCALLPAALLMSVVGSVVGGLLAMFFGQAAMDTSSAFFGKFAFVCGCGLVAPSQREKVTLAAAGLVALLALSTIALGVFSVEPFVSLSAREKVLTPTAQLLGALYAVFLLPPLVRPDADLGREIVALGTTVALFGLVFALVGLVPALLGHGWIGVAVGSGVVVLGVVTWLYPFLRLTLLRRRLLSLTPEQVSQLVEQHSKEK